MAVKFLQVSSRLNKKQRGFLLPLALFMIVVASGLALALLQQVNQPAFNSTTSAVATKTVYAAETGAQLAVHQIFFPPTTPAFNRQQMDARCENLTVGPSFNISGLNQCRLQVSCECRYENNTNCDSSDNDNYNGSSGVENSFYRIESEALCGEGFAQGYYRLELNKKAP